MADASAARPRGRGRPRDDSIDVALRQAALDEFADRGFTDMSMESIAARAGVSKVTLYRRWNSKLAVAAEVLRLLGQTTAAPADQGSLRADLRRLLRATIGSADARASATILLRTMGEISGNPELLALYRTHLLGPRLRQLRAVLDRARARGELRADLPDDVVALTIGGPLFLHQLSLLAGLASESPDDLADHLAEAILGGVAR